MVVDGCFRYTAEPLDEHGRAARTFSPEIPERRLRKGRAWTLETVEVTITPRMRRVIATGPDLGAFACLPGQSLILVLPQADDEPAARHHTVRAFDTAKRRLALDFVLHGGGPANRWVRTVEPGGLFAAVGPRGQKATAAAMQIAEKRVWAYHSRI